MRVYFTRDSVHAGDDGDAPHPRELTLPDDFTVDLLVRSVLAAGLPSIAGGKATWCVSSGIPLAVFAQEWREPKFLNSIPPKREELDIRGDTLCVHLSYFAQQHPQVVYDVLVRLQVRVP